MWKGKDHMEVRGIDYFGTAFIHPDFFINGLAIRTVTVTAGIIVYFGMPTFRADTDVTATFLRFAADNSMGCFPLDI